MMRAMSSGVAGLKAHQTALDVIGNNVANVNTAGFKASSTLFRDVLYQTLTSARAGNGTTTGGMNPAQVGYGSTAATVTVNTGRAAMNATGFSNDCYINGEGYYVVQDGTDFKYTRVAELTFDSNGNLTDGYGNRICGVTNTAEGLAYTPPTGEEDDSLAIPDDKTKILPITYDPAAYTLKDVAFGADGLITATDQNNHVVTVGRLALAHFVNPAALSQEGNSYYKWTENSGNAQFAKAGDGGTGALVSGALEASNVDLANEFANMITTERGYQANSKVITVADTMLETLVNMVR